MFGKVGHNAGRTFSAETRSKQSMSHSGIKHWNYGNKDTPKSQKTGNKISKTLLGRSKLKCPHCPMICDPSNAKRYHFDNCKWNPNKQQ